MASGLNLKTSLVNVFGPGESGKSNFIKHLLSQPAYRRHVVFDPMKEFDPDQFNVYRPDHIDYDEGGNDELNSFLSRVLDWPAEIRPRYIVVDEAANFIPGGNKPIGAMVNRVAQHNTHIKPGLTLITSNRHPTDLDNTIREMYDHMFVFGARGRGADALDALVKGLSDEVASTGEYEFVHVDQQGNSRVFEPVDDMGDYERV